MAKGGFVVNVADLLQRPGARRHERIAAPVEQLRVVDTVVPAGSTAALDAVLEWVSEGILATGTVGAGWVSSCRRCLRPIEGRAEASYQELFEPQAREGETYPLRGDRIDMGPLVREALLVELPLAPLCQEDCAGLCPTCGADLNAGPCGCAAGVQDPRWAALDGLFTDPPVA